MRLALALFGAIFLRGGYQQLTDPGPRAEMGRGIGLVAPLWMVRVSGAVMVTATTALQVRRLRRVGLLTLALQLPFVTLIGQRWWELPPGPDRERKKTLFTKNVSLFGALLVLLVDPGRGDGRRRDSDGRRRDSAAGDGQDRS